MKKIGFFCSMVIAAKLLFISPHTLAQASNTARTTTTHANNNSTDYSSPKTTTPTHPQTTATPAVRQPKPTAITIAVLGDSLSAGYGIATEEGWVALLAKKLHAIDPQAKVINGSVSGATTDAGLQMQVGLLAAQPSHMIIELGANDGLQGKPLPLIQKNLAQLIRQAQQQNIRILLLGVQLPPNLGKRYTQPFFAQYATLANHYNTALVPFFLEGVAGESTLMQADGLHPNAKAQPIILNNIWPALAATLPIPAAHKIPVHQQ